MSANDIIMVIFLPAVVGLTLLFYPHCSRPPLAFASAPRSAFWVCMGSLIVVIAGSLVRWVDLVVDALPDSIGLSLSVLVLLSFLPLAIAFSRPRWFRVLGRPDATAAPRLLLTWFRRESRRMDDHRQLGFSKRFVAQLETVRAPANATFVDPWIETFQAFVHATDLGHASSHNQRAALDERLAAVAPVDPIARWV